MEIPTKSLTIPVDGSKNSLRAIDYLEHMYGGSHDVKVLLCYILPSLPLIFENDKDMTKEERAKVRALEKKNIQVAEEILADAKAYMAEKGFPEEKIETAYKKKNVTITKDVCHYAETGRSDAILLTRHGRTEIKDFFMGEVSKSLVEYCQELPVWIVGGDIQSKKVLIAVDSSENALRAVDHASFMLAGTDADITIFHTLRHVRRFIPMDVIKEAPDIEEVWRNKASQEVTPYIEKAKTMLMETGIPEEKITIKIEEGTRSPANDIIKFAKDGGYGTLILGRRGISMLKELLMGSVTNKIIQQSDGFAVWIIQ